MTSEPSSRFGSAQLRPRRASSITCSCDSPASLISKSGVMPKWAMIVPTIRDATATLTNVRTRPCIMGASPAGPPAAHSSPIRERWAPHRPKIPFNPLAAGYRAVSACSGAVDTGSPSRTCATLTGRGYGLGRGGRAAGGRHRMAFEAVAHRIELGPCGTGAVDQRLRVRPEQRIVPRPGDYERQFECRGRVACRQEARGALEVEVACGDRRRARQHEPHGRRLDPEVFDHRGPLRDLDVDCELIEGRLAAAEVAASSQRVALEPPKQLLDVDAGDGSLLAHQVRAATEPLRELVDVAAGAVEVEGQRSFALDAADADKLAEPLIEIDVGELHLRAECRPGFRLSESKGTDGYAAEGLGFSNRNGEVPAAQIGGNRGASELGGAERDASGRQPQVDIDAGESTERDRLAAPVVAGAQADGREVGREVERLGGERALQAPPPVAREGEDAFADIAVELDVDAGKRDGAADDVGLRLEGETAEAARRRVPMGGPAQRVPQRGGIGGERALHLERGPVADVAVEGELQRRADGAQLEAGPVAGQRSDEVAEAQRRVDRLVMPDEAPGRGEGLRDRRPRQRKLHVGQRLDDLVGLVVQHHGAVGDADLRERFDPVGARLQGAGKRVDMTRPVRAAALRK